ncbi:hypothetical protein M0802_009420 [Mischocyttarus mexicanus]|nr:hypothetical protein M0802_009420 [Mischocyttarus mexicanus]
MSNLLVRKSLELFEYNDFKKDVDNIFGCSKKINIYEAKKQLVSNKDLTEQNVLGRTVEKRYALKPKKKNKQESTAFTEEDFKKFEQEYIDQ